MKKSQKEDIERDEFMEASERLVEWGMKNRDKVLIVVVIVLVAIIGMTFVRRSGEQAHQAQMDQFADAFTAYSDALSSSDAEERSTMMADADSLFADFASEHGDELGNFATYMQGNTWFWRGATEENYKKAAELFERYANNATSRTDKARGHLAAGYARESQMFMADDSKLAQTALDAFKKAADLGGNTWVAADAKLGQARVLANLDGRAAEALPLLESVKKSREWEAPYTTMRDAANITDDQRELIADAMFTIDEYGLRHKAEMLEASIRGKLGE